MKIPLQAIPFLYSISKKFYDKELSLTNAINSILETYEMNKNSATDYVYNFKHLMKGERFTRTLNADSMEYYLENILNDYGQRQLSISLDALELHINYYKKQQNTTMRKMRSIYKTYLAKNIVPVLIENYEQLLHNIESIENALVHDNDEIRSEAAKLIKRGKCFVAYEVDKEVRFAPSRFLGYENNRIFKFSPNEVDGRDTNDVINDILEEKPIPNIPLDKKYIEYCKKLGIPIESKIRKFWKLKLSHDFSNNEEIIGEFPEGKIVERTHKVRERNSKVVKIAKANFIKKHGKLFCQVCSFDFHEKYGNIGVGFIEGHHTIAVSEMTPNYKTKPEEIAMLCSNCHKMVHKKRPWLIMEKLSELINK